MDDPLEWFRSLPPLTRAWFGLTVTLTAAVTLDFLPPSHLTFDWHKIRHQQELWRLLTPFCYAEGPLREFPTLILMWLIYVFSKGYERNPYDTGAGGTAADYAFALLFCAAVTLLTYPLVLLYSPMFVKAFPYPVLPPLFTRTLAYAVLYLWSRRNPHARADVNFIPMEGRYLPFAHLGISLFMGQRVGAMVHGIGVGHLYYWLVDIVPRFYGKGVLRTPQFLVDCFAAAPGGGEAMAEVRVGDDGELPPNLPPNPPPNADGAWRDDVRADVGRAENDALGAPGRIGAPNDAMEAED